MFGNYLDRLTKCLIKRSLFARTVNDVSHPVDVDSRREYQAVTSDDADSAGWRAMYGS